MIRSTIHHGGAMSRLLRNGKMKSAGFAITGGCVGFSIASQLHSDPQLKKIHSKFPMSSITQCLPKSQSSLENTNDDDDKQNMQNVPDILSNSSSSSSLILPTLQAANRARRLVQTILLMIIDYEKKNFEKSELIETIQNTLLTLQHSFSILPESSYTKKDDNYVGIDVSDDKQSVIADQQMYWEKEVETRKIKLKQAQHEYTTDASVEELKEWNKENNNTDDIDVIRSNYQKAKRSEVRKSAELLGKAEEMLAKVGNQRTSVHAIAARRLLQLCRENGGVYVKIGQHLANLDYLIPAEYIETLSELFNDAPVSQYSDVCEVIKEELGKYPDELFESFSEKPIASASLAQVHIAIEKGTRRKLAVKVQHRGLRETSVGDLKALEYAIGTIDCLFKDFTYGWIVEEIAPNLPIELDFSNEGKNAEKSASHMQKTGLDCVVPEVIWNKTTSRVLCMQFEDGFNCTNLNEIEKSKLQKKDIVQLISSVFNAQVFQSGFVHCDPHPANVLLREHPTKKGKPQIVLVDHGLYKQIDDDFRIVYARLWKALMMADLKEIENSAAELGVAEMYPLLAGMLTSRPFDETIERSKSGTMDFKSKAGDAGDKAMIQGYAQRYIKEIFALLDVIPRQMLLLLKMNDCLRHVDFALGSPLNSLVVAGDYASAAVYEHNQRYAKSRQNLIKNWFEYIRVQIQIRAYEVGFWWLTHCRNLMTSNKTIRMR